MQKPKRRALNTEVSGFRNIVEEKPSRLEKDKSCVCAHVSVCVYMSLMTGVGNGFEEKLEVICNLFRHLSIN